jgi:rubrerythrin
MQSAFNSRSNAHVRYLALAQRADNEGYGEIASLFRAIARAEEIHAENHAEVTRE